MKKYVTLTLISIFLMNCSPDDNPLENPIPIIGEISSSSGKIGDDILINGTNFSEIAIENIVKFNGIQAEVVNSSTSQLKVSIPSNATTGVLTLKVNNGPTVTIGNFVIIDIISKWRKNKWFYNNQEETLTDCEKQSYLEFSSNLTFDRKAFFLFNNDCTEEGNADSNKTFVSDLQNNKITLRFDDIDEGTQTEILNILELTETKLIYTWDEDNDGTDEHKLEYIKYN